MPDTLLQTKLYIPPLRPNLVPRPGLIKLLNQGLQLGHKLTLVSAPAGFGKTTLVSEWVAGLEHPAAWLSLDEADSDLLRVLTYLVTALQSIAARQSHRGSFGDGMLSALQSPQPPPIESILTTLLNEITTIPDTFVLVLDDYHAIDAGSIDALNQGDASTGVDASTDVDGALNFLLKHMPAQMHLVIATREDPLLSLARLRARSQLTELRATDLRFSSSEAVEFLNRVMGLNLSEEEISALDNRTEGWVAGLQLAAISMQGNSNTSGFIKSFTGSHRYVLDYLLEEVLNQQSESVQSFLLQTAILDRLTGSLCNALTGQDNGQATLVAFERANLFIVPLDDERRWYRYHHLFVDLLRQRLRQNLQEQISALHRQASEWYEKNGLVDDAVDHSFRSKSFQQAARLIEENIDALWQAGEHAKLRRWLKWLPDEMVISRPQLCIFHAWYLFASGQHDAAERTLQTVEQVLEPVADRTNKAMLQWRALPAHSDMEKLRGRAAAIRAFMDSYQGDVAGIIQHAHLALEHLPEQDLTWRSLTAMALGDAQGFLGDMHAAYEARQEVLTLYRATGDIYYVMLATMKLAITLREQGNLQRTMTICQRQVEIADDHGLSKTGLAGLMLLIKGEVLVELNDMDGAMKQAKKGAELVERSVDLAILGWGYMCLMRIFFSRGDLAAFEKIVQKTEKIAREANIPPWILNQAEAWQTRTWINQDNLEATSHWVEKRGLDVRGGMIDPSQVIDFFSLSDYVVQARILVAQVRLDEALQLLQTLLEAAEAGDRTSKVIEILILQALSVQAKGNSDNAIIMLDRALTLAKPEGFIRIFVDEGQPMARLLRYAHHRGMSPEYLRRLLAAFPEDDSVPGDSTTYQVDQSELVEPLSERELEVLQHIADGFTNKEVADRLYLSLNTVKVHTRNIYGKLNVHSRTQAIARSQELGLLSRK